MIDLSSEVLARAKRAPETANAQPSLAHAVLPPPIDAEVSQLSKSYGGPPIFSDVSFRLVRSEAVALVGANGTGKSTLLRCLLGLTAPTSGSVALLGQPVTDARPAALRRLRSQTGLVAQKHNLVPRLSVLSNVIHGLLGQRKGPWLWSHTTAPDDVRAAAIDALRSVGLEHLAMRRADRLSGGQSQRVAIARALISKPKFLIADEPCASLDPSAGKDVMDLFFDLVRREGVTVVFTSHDIDHALTYGDRILGLADGCLKLDVGASSLSKSDLRGLYD